MTKHNKGFIWLPVLILYLAGAGVVSFIAAKECTLHSDKCKSIVKTN